MNMKRRLVSALSLLFCLGVLAAEEEPEIAYRILTGYFDKKTVAGNSGAKIAGGILAGAGGLLMAGAATTWFAGDAIAANSGGSFDPQTKTGVTIGLGVGGLALAAAGSTIMTAKAQDYRAEYPEIFKESDAQVREALSVAVLRDLSIKAENARVTGALSSLLVPLLSAAITAGVNLSKGKLWYDGVVSSVSWSAWGIAGGISRLFGSSEEERLYQKYQAAREAMYGRSGPGD
ncbi:MAG TPA: hypothetical protein VMV44_02560 [Rectinemataceae bacterium]|nr:hypothetical protein [Rectinemataceae bacterium]